MRRLLCVTSVSIGVLNACGCSGGGVVATENDRLRSRVLALEGDVKSLQGRNAELQRLLAEASRTPASVPADVLANTPRMTSISLNRLSQARDEDGDGEPDTLVLYLEPADGLGRFMQIVGSVALHAAVLPADAPAQTIGRATIGPAELRDGYRSSFTGQYYSLSMPITPPPLPSAQPLPPANTASQPDVPPDTPSSQSITQCTVRVQFTDGYTGEVFATERVIDLR